MSANSGKQKGRETESRQGEKVRRERERGKYWGAKESLEAISILPPRHPVISLVSPPKRLQVQNHRPPSSFI